MHEDDNGKALAEHLEDLNMQQNLTTDYLHCRQQTLGGLLHCHMQKP